ncbi:MAG: hypothetical protein QGG25_16030, partial [Phycisphaerae bacterium]|nr:hypothetical protein [Phycisphaerae bacterium]
RADTKEPPVVTDDEISGMKAVLEQCAAGQSVEGLLERLCPTLFCGIEIANSFVNSGKQFAVYLNDNYTISIIYDEVDGGVTRFVSGEILERNT